LPIENVGVRYGRSERRQDGEREEQQLQLTIDDHDGLPQKNSWQTDRAFYGGNYAEPKRHANAVSDETIVAEKRHPSVWLHAGHVMP
jgi:hypothetical protein